MFEGLGMRISVARIERRIKKEQKNDPDGLITDCRISKADDGLKYRILVKTDRHPNGWKSLVESFSRERLERELSQLKGKGYSYSRNRITIYPPNEIEAAIERFLVEAPPSCFTTETVTPKIGRSIEIDVANVESSVGLECLRGILMDWIYPEGRLSELNLDELKKSHIGVDVNVSSRQYIEVYRHGSNPRRLYLN